MARGRTRKETRDEAIARADGAERRALLHLWALNYVLRDSARAKEDKVVQWFENAHWRLGVCPEQPSGRVVVVFEWARGRVHADGSHAGEWRAEFLEDLQVWRRETFRHLSVSTETQALAELLDVLSAALSLQASTAAVGRVEPPTELPAVVDDDEDPK